MRVLSVVTLITSIALANANPTPEPTSDLQERHYGGDHSTTVVPIWTTKRECNALDNHFWYSSGNCCLPQGGPPKVSSPPHGVFCPIRYYFHLDFKGCVPYQNTPDWPSCDGDKWWNPNSKCCEPHQPATTTTKTWPQPSGSYHKKRLPAH